MASLVGDVVSIRSIPLLEQVQWDREKRLVGRWLSND
jgi:hypothetical protein